ETGLPLQKIGEEVSHKLAHRPGSYFLKRIIRPKKASSSLPCQKAFSPNVEPMKVCLPTSSPGNSHQN
ncbi:MAG TPA: hypothetical protein PKW79_06840, partial [Rhabdochlamydiaceae bacterium]|nr:hypothetical protein [Rhabdochlamydiaceae bacterium]